MGRHGKNRKKDLRAVPAAGQGRHRVDFLIPATAALAAVILYSNTLHDPFVYDDRVTILGNTAIRRLTEFKALLLHDLFRPLVNLSYALDYIRSGLDPRAYHQTNILLHGLNVILLALLVRRLVPRLSLAQGTEGRNALRLAMAAAALLFAVHPMMTEAVTYISGRSELLSSFFFLIAFLCLDAYLFGELKSRWSLAAGLTAFLCSLASKESAAMLPFVLLASDRLLSPQPLRDEFPRRLRRFHLPLISLISVAGLARVWVFLFVEGGANVSKLWENLIVEAGVIWRYLGLMLLPVSQSILHDVRAPTGPFDPGAILAILAWIPVFYLLYLLRKKAPLAVLGLLMFLLLLAPSHLIPLSEAMAEHRCYTPSIGFFLAVGGLVARGWLSLRARAARRGLLAAAALLPVLLASATLKRNRLWADPVALWADAARKAPRTWAAQYAYADELRRAGRLGEAEPIFEKATRLRPEMIAAYLNLGICRAQLGDPEGARRAFEKAADLEPRNPKVYNNLALLAIQGKDARKAEAFLEKALSCDPNNLRALELAAQLYSTEIVAPSKALAVCRRLKSLGDPAPWIEECIRSSRAALD